MSFRDIPHRHELLVSVETRQLGLDRRKMLCRSVYRWKADGTSSLTDNRKFD